MIEIEFVKSMDVIGIKENDMLVVKIDQKLSAAARQNIHDHVSSNLPIGLKGKISVFVLEPGIDIGVIRKEAI